MVRSKEVARMSTGDKFPPRKLLWQDAPCPPDVALELRKAASHAASIKARKIVATAPQKATHIIKAPPKVAAKPVVEAAVAVQAPKPVAKASVAVQTPKPVARAAVAVQAPVEAPPKRPVRKTTLKSLSRQKATKTLSKQVTNPSKQKVINSSKQKLVINSSKQKVTNPSKQLATKSLSKKTVSEASSSAENDISISITCKHCKKRQRLNTAVVELCRREEKRKRIVKLRSHPEEIIDLSEADSDS